MEEITGTTGNIAEKAPFLNYIMAVPLVVVPSAKIQRGWNGFPSFTISL
jgi:hypothetical protein